MKRLLVVVCVLVVISRFFVGSGVKANTYDEEFKKLKPYSVESKAELYRIVERSAKEMVPHARLPLGFSNPGKCSWLKVGNFCFAIVPDKQRDPRLQHGGRMGTHIALVLSFVEKSDKGDFEAVIAHELGHKHGDWRDRSSNPHDILGVEQGADLGGARILSLSGRDPTNMETYLAGLQTGRIQPKLDTWVISQRRESLKKNLPVLAAATTAPQ